MTATGTALDCAQGVTCTRCGVWLEEPDCSEGFPEEKVVLNLWSCTDCGNKFETEAAAPADAKSAAVAAPSKPKQLFRSLERA